MNGLRLFLIGSGTVTNAAAVKAVSRKGGKEELLKGPFYYTIVLTLSTVVFWRNPTGKARPLHPERTEHTQTECPLSLCLSLSL